ncbi:MAG: hypothetical protein ACI8RD_011076, partial [Bacillariaceae sp.]
DKKFILRSNSDHKFILFWGCLLFDFMRVFVVAFVVDDVSTFFSFRRCKDIFR